MRKFFTLVILLLLASHYSFGQRTYDLSYSLEILDGNNKHVDTVFFGKTYSFSITVANKSTTDFKGDITFQVGIDPKHTEPPFDAGDVSTTYTASNFTVAHLSTATFSKSFKVGTDLFKKGNASVIIITWPTDGVSNHDKDTTNDHALIKIYVADPEGVATGIAPNAQQAGIQIYPNPARDNATVTLGDMSGTATFTLTDITGKVMSSMQMNVQPGKQITLPLMQNGKLLPAGVYMLNVENGDKRETAKLLITQ